jgi:zinc transport system substrate-binding protein
VWTWKHFETAEEVPYKHLIILPAEADIPGETMIHFHFRYGSDLDKLLAADGWFATMIAYDSTMDLLVGHMTAD